MARRMKVCIRCMLVAAWLPTLAAACWVCVFVMWSMKRETPKVQPTIEQTRPAVSPLTEFDPVRVVSNTRE